MNLVINIFSTNDKETSPISPKIPNGNSINPIKKSNL